MTREQEAFFREVVDAVRAATRRHPTITNMECVAILGRCIALCVAASAPHEREGLVQLALENIRQSAGPAPPPRPN